MSGKPAEGIFRMNSTYPKDGFWWDSQLRITPPFQAGDHFLEPYAHAVAELDALRVTRGGLFLDKAHGDQIRRFRPGLSGLAREKVRNRRWLNRPGRRANLGFRRAAATCIWLIATTIPSRSNSNLPAPTGQATDLATGQPVDAPAVWKVTLGPYDLRSFALPKQVELKGFAATAPPEIVAQLTAEAEDALAMIERIQKAGKPLPTGTGQMAAGIKAAIKDGRLAWLRRALNSYPVRKWKQLAGAKGV